LVKAARKPKKGDEDADFTVKNNKVHYGYKDHIAIDEENEFILEFIWNILQRSQKLRKFPKQIRI